MKFNKKGFTLVELLAVIVILAIIAVIAVPSILGIIEGARKDSFAADVRSAFKAAELKYVRDSMDTAFAGGSQVYDVATDLDLENNALTGVITVSIVGDTTTSTITTAITGKGYTTSTGVTMGTFATGITKTP